MLDEFSATVEKIYAAAAEPGLWSDALKAVEDLTGSTGAVLNLVPKPGSQPVVLAGSFSRADCSEYALDYMWRCPRIAFFQRNPKLPVHFDRMILSEAEMDRDATYAWFGKHGLRYYVAGWCGENASHRAYMSLQRSRRQGHVEREDVDRFTLLLGHFTRAFGLATSLGNLRSFHSFSSAMLEALPQAVFALDGSGRLRFANGRGEALLAAADGIHAEDGRLRTTCLAEQAPLENAIRSAIAPLDGPPSGWLRVSRQSGRLPYAMFVAPLAVAEEEMARGEARVLVMVHDPGEQRAADPEMLTSLYRLTETEARLASALSAGHSVESAAALLGMQPSTARAHLKHIFSKVGVNRQQDLVRLLTSLSALKPVQDSTVTLKVPS